MVKVTREAQRSTFGEEEAVKGQSPKSKTSGSCGTSGDRSSSQVHEEMNTSKTTTKAPCLEATKKVVLGNDTC